MRLGRIGGIGAVLALTTVLACRGKNPETAAITEAGHRVKTLTNLMQAQTRCIPVIEECRSNVIDPAKKLVFPAVIETMQSGCRVVYDVCVLNMSRALDEAARIPERLRYYKPAL